MTTWLVVMILVLGTIFVGSLLRAQWKSASGTAYLREDLRRAMDARDFDKIETIMLELVDRWHASPRDEGRLSAFCGMTDEEYNHFTTHPRGKPIMRPYRDPDLDVAEHAVRHTQECCGDFGQHEDLLRSSVRHLVMWSAFNHGLASHGSILSPSTAVIVWGDLETRYVKCELRFVQSELRSDESIMHQTWSQGIDGQEIVVGERTPEQRLAWLRDGEQAAANDAT